jgi:hypothetical protein
MKYSKTAIALIVQLVMAALIAFGAAPEAAQAAATSLGTSLEQLYAIVVAIINGGAMWFNKVRTGTMRTGTAGLLVKE